MNNSTIDVLIKDMISSKAFVTDKASFLQVLLEHCVLQLGGSKENLHDKTLHTKLCYILTQIGKHIEQEQTKVDILSKLSDELNVQIAQFKKVPSTNFENLIDKMNIIDFNDKISNFINYAGGVNKKTPVKIEPNLDGATWLRNSSANSTAPKDCSERYLRETIFSLVSCINQIITIDWKSLFIWKLNYLGCKVIEGIKDTNSHSVMLSLFMACKCLQIVSIDKGLVPFIELKSLTNVLEPYIQQHATTEEMTCIKYLSSGKNGETKSNDTVDKIGKL